MSPEGLMWTHLGRSDAVGIFEDEVLDRSGRGDIVSPQQTAYPSLRAVGATSIGSSRSGQPTGEEDLGRQCRGYGERVER